MRTVDVLLAQASASFAEHSWGDAYARFATADAATSLDLDDLEKLALTAYLTGHDEESRLAWTRAHHEAIRRDARRRPFAALSGMECCGRSRWAGSKKGGDRAADGGHDYPRSAPTTVRAAHGARFRGGRQRMCRSRRP